MLWFQQLPVQTSKYKCTSTIFNQQIHQVLASHLLIFLGKPLTSSNTIQYALHGMDIYIYRTYRYSLPGSSWRFTLRTSRLRPTPHTDRFGRTVSPWPWSLAGHRVPQEVSFGPERRRFCDGLGMDECGSKKRVTLQE